MMLRKILFPLLLLSLISGCASAPVLRQVVPGVAIETLQGSVNISLATPDGQMSGNGFLFYQRPDNFRLAILAPFGQSIIDIIVTGEQVLCLMESRKTGWQGKVSDLPDRLGMNIWPLMKWVVEPQRPPGPALGRIFTRADGTLETVYYDASGYVQRKVNTSGDEILYSDYKVTENSTVPGRIEIKTAEGSRLALTFDEPELNRLIDREIFNPKLDRYQIQPLTELKGF